MWARLSDAPDALAPLSGADATCRPWTRRVALTLLLAAGFAAATAVEAGAFTLRLVFPGGEPMTYGSACAGVGCLQRGDRVGTTDERGEIHLPDSPRTIEYRRDGIRLGLAPAGVASGTIVAVGNRATVVLPRILAGTAPAIDEVESDLVARLNEARAARGLSLAQINPRLSTAADMQATWLTQAGITFAEPSLFHIGPFGTDMAFRHGEVSLPDPRAGGEIAEAGGTIDETISDWLSSADHRDQVLAPGKLLIGAARVGTFIIVQTRSHCDGCAQEGTGRRVTVVAPPVLPAGGVPPPAGAGPTAGSGRADAPRPACGREQVATRRLQSLRGRVRLRVATRCLRPGARYVLLIRQGTSGKLLRTVRIRRAGTTMLRLRPGRTVNRLRIKLKRDGRVAVARTMSLRT